MRYTKEQKEDVRNRILQAASRSFKKGGYSGVGVDSLAKEAGVTSGAFYVHFKSKAEAFRASIVEGLKEVQDSLTHLKKEHGSQWWSKFAEIYMGQKRTCDLNESCAMQSLTAEVGRFDDETKALYETELKIIIEIASQNYNKEDKAKALANISMLVGGVTLARAVNNDALALEIAEAIKSNIYTFNKVPTT